MNISTGSVRQKSFFSFVLSESKFSFFNRIELLFFYVILLGSLVVACYLFWNLLFSKMVMYGSWLLLLLLIWGLRIDKKFTEPYSEYRGIDKQAGIKRSQLFIEFNNAVGRFSSQKLANRAILALGIAIIFVGGYLGIIVIPNLGLPGPLFRWAVFLVILTLALMYLKVRHLWKTIETKQIDEQRGLRRVQLAICFVCFISSVLLFGVWGYRFKEMTGHSILQGDSSDVMRIEKGGDYR